MKKYDSQVAKLENEELEVSAADVNLYTKLFAYYLVQNKLYDAKYLWKRIPQNMKVEHGELDRLYTLLQALVANNLSVFFKTVKSNEWTDEIQPVMDDLFDTTRNNVLNLIGNAYTSILGENLINLTTINEDQFEETCLALDWKFKPDNQLMVVHPKRSATSAFNTANSEYQLSKLTEFVSFLEN